MATHSRPRPSGPFTLPAPMVAPAIIVTAAALPAALIHTPTALIASAATGAASMIALFTARSLRRASSTVDRILAEELSPAR